MKNRRELLQLVALGGGAVYASGLAGYAAAATAKAAATPYDDF